MEFILKNNLQQSVVHKIEPKVDLIALNRRNIKAILTLAMAFFILFVAFTSSANIYSKLMRDIGYGNLGFYGLSLLYASFSIGCFLAPSITSMISKPQRAFQGSAITYTLWIIGAYIGATSQNDAIVVFSGLLGNVLVGFGASTLWVTHGKYLSDFI